MNDETRSNPACSCHTTTPLATASDATSWQVRVLMHDARSGRDLVLARSEHPAAEEAAHATDWFPPIAHYSVFSLQIAHEGQEQSRHPICGLAFAARFGTNLQEVIDRARAGGADAQPAPRSRTLQ